MKTGPLGGLRHATWGYRSAGGCRAASVEGNYYIWVLLQGWWGVVNHAGVRTALSGQFSTSLSTMHLVTDDDRGAGRTGDEQGWWQCMVTASSDGSPGMTMVQYN